MIRRKMKILVLNGSPRKNGNTDMLTEAFINGAEKTNEVEVIQVRDYKINPCTGCNYCKTSEGAVCVQKDDMSIIFEKLKTADVIVFASPVYFYGISSQLKALVDRLHTPMRKEFNTEKLGLILVGAATLPELFDSIIIQYELCMKYFKLGDIGRVLVRGALEKGDVSGDDLKKAYLLGESV